jgi:hypothetical protein
LRQAGQVFNKVSVLRVNAKPNHNAYDGQYATLQYDEIDYVPRCESRNAAHGRVQRTCEATETAVHLHYLAAGSEYGGSGHVRLQIAKAIEVTGELQRAWFHSEHCAMTFGQVRAVYVG